MKKIKIFSGSDLINNVKKGCLFFYEGVERPFSFSSLKPYYKKYNIDKNIDNKKWLREITITNKIMKTFYKRTELQINDFENISFFRFKSKDNLDLAGLLYEPNKNSNKWLIASHWFAGHKSWALHHSKIFAKMGYNILVYDFRGHGQSQKSETYMGGIEVLDLMGAVDWLKENRKIESLALMGTSMGAFVSNFSGLKYQNELQNANLKFIVSDVAYASIYNLFLHIKNIYLGIIPKYKSKRFINKLLEKENRKENQIDFHSLDVFKLIEKADKSKLFPTLFLHSLNDRVTRPSDTYECIIRRGCPEDKYLMYNFSTHTQAIRHHFKSFNYEIAKFINNFDKNDELFNKVVEEWNLLNYDKKDRRSEELK